MFDRETGSVWHHFNGQAKSGYYAGERLKFLPVQMMTWEQWKAQYSDTAILSDATGYEQNYRPITHGAIAGYTNSFTDTRLTVNALVLDVQSSSGAKAYPQQLVAEAGGVVNDAIGDGNIVVFFDESGSCLA
jgi:hypothetical protein